MAGFQVISFNNSSKPKVVDYKRRRNHSKTRLGCVACRVKRVKCDEGKPTCLRCQRNARSCQYGDPTTIARTATSIMSPRPTFALACTDKTAPAFLIQHLERYQTEILCMPTASHIVDLFHSSFLTRQSILALAAGHLRYRSPKTPRYRLTAHYQQSIALSAYRDSLSSPVKSQGAANQLFLSAILLNMHVFMLANEHDDEDLTDPYASWVFSTDVDRLGWLSLQAGVRPLLLSMMDYVIEAMDFLTPFFTGREKERLVFPMTDTLSVVPEHWLEAFGYDPASSKTGCDLYSIEDVYRPALIIAARLRNLDPHRENIFHNIGFLAKLYPRYRDLLHQRDIKALWLFGYWLGMMCRYKDVWWSEKRVKRDYRAVKMWLRMTGIAARDNLWGRLIEEMEGIYTDDEEDQGKQSTGTSEMSVSPCDE